MGKITRPSSGVCDKILWNPFCVGRYIIYVYIYIYYILHIKSVMFCKDVYDISVQGPVLTHVTGNEKVNTSMNIAH